MRAMRVSGYIVMGKPPLTLVMPEDSVVDTLESIRTGASADLDRILIVADIFEIADDADTQQITAEGMRRWTPEVQLIERNMSVLYHYTVSQFPLVGPKGTIASRRVAPMSSANVRLVFEQLAQHPDYGERTIISLAEDMTPVIMRGGTIE